MPPPTIADLLSAVPWMRELQQHQRERVIADTYETHHRKGASVSHVGDPSRAWIYVADGLLKVSAHDAGGRIVMFTGVSSGGWIGEGAVIKGEVRRYDMYAMRDSRLLNVPSATVRWLLDTSLEFNHAMIAQLNERLSQYISMVETDRMVDPTARVARSLAVLFNQVLYPNRTAAVPLSQQELGELVGLTRQSISVALKQLQAEGHVTVGYSGLVVRNVEALRLYADTARSPAGRPAATH